MATTIDSLSGVLERSGLQWLLAPPPGSRRGNVGLEAGLSAAVELAPNVHAFAAYDFTLRGETTSHAAKLGLKVSW